MTGHARILIVGAGVIGSYAAQQIARLPEVGSIIVVDPDYYSFSNIAGQNIELAHVGQSKAVVTEKALKRIRPDLSVRSYTARIEQVPLAALQCDVILLCLDNRRSRMFCNEISYRLGGVPLVDAGVLASQLLVRVNAYLPGKTRTCIECHWGEDDYRNLEVEYPCQAENLKSSAAPTNSAPYLGALAASLQTAECAKIVAGKHDKALYGKSLVVGIAPHSHSVTLMPHNTMCKFDHDTWVIEAAPARLVNSTVASILSEPETSLSVYNSKFAFKRTCSSCGAVAPALRIVRERENADGKCRRCGGASQALPFDMRDQVTHRSGLSDALLARTLKSIGVVPDDVVTISTPSGVRHYFADGNGGRS